jgi:ubiquinone biosynthesis protein UbiJ
MSLSNNVNDFIDEAKGNIRSAIAAAARNERPIVIQQLSEVLRCLDSINKMEQATDDLESLMNKLQSKMKRNGGDGEGFTFGPFSI